MDAWIGSVSAIVGVLLGGLITLLITRSQLRHREARERTMLILAKLEELHQLLGNYAISTFNMMGELIEGDIDQFHRLIRQILPAHKIPERHKRTSEPMTLDRISLLIGAYAPEIKGHLEKLMNVTLEFSEALRGISRAKMKQQHSEETEHFKKLVQKHGELDHLCAEMQAEVVSVSRKYL